jgi:phosphoglycerate dehydrogenase-like enzyme
LGNSGSTTRGKPSTKIETLGRVWPFTCIRMACAGSDSSKGLIGSAQLSLMKPRSYLINTARAEVIDKNALYEALK